MAQNNKLIGILSTVGLLAVAVLAGTYPSWKKTSNVSGDFTGTAQGMGGDVTVTLTIKDNHLEDVKAEGKGETKGLGDKAIEKITQEMIDNATIDVDTVSGATVSSTAMLNAAEEALTSAGLKASDLK